MWKYETNLAWTTGKEGRLEAEGKPALTVATPPEFGGPAGIWTPEDLLTGAVASCLMTSFLFFAEKASLALVSYRNRATSVMEKTPQGLAITRVQVEISVVLKQPGQEEAARQALARAEQTCPLSHSLKCPVTLTLNLSNE